MAQETSRRAASDSPKSAANFVRRGAAASQSCDATLKRGRAERDALIQNCESRGKIIESSYLDQFSYQASGGEHSVYHDRISRRAVKVTHANRFGNATYGPQLAATAHEYLMRLAWCNTILGDDFRLVGIIYDGEEIRVVSTQPWISAHEFRPHPEREEINEYFGRFNFLPASGNEDAPLYFNARSGLVIIDAYDLNVIRDRNEELVAIDVGIGPPGPDLRRAIEEYFQPTLKFIEGPEPTFPTTSN